MPGVRRVLSLFLALAALTLGACGSDSGSDETVPSNLASQLIQPLEAAQDALAANDCPAVQESAKDFSQEVSAIPQDQIDDKVKKALVDASGSLKDLSQSQCEDTGTTDNSGATGETGAVSPSDGPVPADTKNKPSDSAPADATADADEPPAATKKAKPAKDSGPEQAKVAKPSKPDKPEKSDKHPGKKGHGHKNGPPGPRGNPNHGGSQPADQGQPATPSGGVAPEEKR